MPAKHTFFDLSITLDNIFSEVMIMLALSSLLEQHCENTGMHASTSLQELWYKYTLITFGGYSN